MAYTTRRKLPYIRFNFEIPFITLYTSILATNYNSLSREWVVLHIKIWKWEFSFNLYSPDNYMVEDKLLFKKLVGGLIHKLGEAEEKEFVDIITKAIEELE